MLANVVTRIRRSFTPTKNTSSDAYLRLLKRLLTRDIFPDQRFEYPNVVHPLAYSKELRSDGRDWPTEADTMVGMKRLDNVHECCATAIKESIPGDFVETGIWRGGCGILMRAVLEAFDDRDRQVWLFDSFEGLPKPDADSFPKDKTDSHWEYAPYLGVSLEQVKSNFAKYELLDERTKFVKGWFRDTIPSNEIRKIAVLRLDGDMYESTWLVLENLYPKLSLGGFAIVDDYGAIAACKAAVDDFRAKHSIASPLTHVDWTGVFWRK
ncbi:MAG TPA: TylF/MycF/NovP-related O-methyltransferase [Terriglobales bacterium]